jgi:hypothetical protein
MKRNMAALAVLAVFFTACIRDVATEPSTLAANHGASASLAPLTSATTIDDQFEEFARRFPGFGGIFRDSTGLLTVYFTDLRSVPDAAVPALLEFVRVGKHQLMGPNRGDLAIVVKPARYDFIRLRNAATIVMSREWSHGVFMLDINEAENRLVIGLSSEAAQAGIVSELTSAGIPSDMVRYSIGSVEPVSTTTIHSRTAPVSGIDVGMPNDVGTLNLCTIGFSFRVRDWNTFMGESQV